MSASIFLIDKDNSLTELKQGAYDSEDLLQRLLADHPSLLSSATGADGGLLLVRREFAVPDSQDGSGRWSLDHLFIDRNAVPVLVEVKRATDTRARREVVAQMLDYAANGVAYWPTDGLIAAFRATAEASGRQADIVLSEFLGEEDPEQFWRSVEANLKSGRIRMIFLADEIGKELRRIVEFLNEQMRPAEVLAVEVVQYLNHNGMRTLVPTLVGATARAEATKTVATPKAPVSEDEWVSQLGVLKGTEWADAAVKLVAWMRGRGLTIGITDSQDAIYAAIPLSDGRLVYAFFIRRSTGNFEISLNYLKKAPWYASEEARMALLEQVRADLPGAKIWSNKPTAWPNLALPAALRPETWDALVSMLDLVCDRAQADVVGH